MTVGAALIQKGVYFAGGVTFVGGLTLVLIDLSRPLENQVKIIDDLRDPLEEGLGEMEEGEFPTFDSTNSEEEPWAGPVYPK